MRFKERSRLHNVEVQVEAASADVEAAASSPEDLAQIVKVAPRNNRHFSVDCTAFYWTKMPSRTFISREKSKPGFKVQSDSLVRGTCSW